MSTLTDLNPQERMEAPAGTPEAGKRYHVNHVRKGRFDMEVLKVFKDRGPQGDYWASGPIIDGHATYISRLNEGRGEVGDHITVRLSLATFEEIT